MALSFKEECTYEEFKKNTKDDGDALLTWQEQESRDTEYESQMSITETKVSAVVGINIPLDESAKTALADYKEEKVTIFFSLDVQKETLGAAETLSTTFDKLADKLPPKEPRYILHKFAHEHDNKPAKKNVFVYYCPDKAKPRVRMFYSTGKSNVLATIDEQKIEEPKRIEISLSTELTVHLIMDELYPKTQIKKVFKKPGRQGKGKARFHGSKFTAK